MNRPERIKLNLLLGRRPSNVVLTTDWLIKNSYSKQLVKRYCLSGWLKSIGHGAYIRTGDELSWHGAVYALQNDIDFPIHIGGLSAIEQYGLAHNIVLDETQKNIYFYNTSANKKRLPSWFIKNFTQHIYVQRYLFTAQIGLEEQIINNIILKISAPERAILELLDLIPKAFSYEHANDLIENLRLLRPKLMQNLLEKCTSIKVKRLFLYLADTYQLPCFAHLNLEQIKLGKGKRLIGEGGIYIPQYQLSVPKIKREIDDEDIGYV